MKNYLLTHSWKIVAVVLLLGVSSCSDPAKVAQKSLAQNQYEFTTGGFLTAAAAGDIESIALFNEAGMSVDSENARGETALMQAAANGRKSAVEQLLGFGADPQKVNAEGRDALISASAKGFEEVSRLLLSRGSDLNIKDREGWNALSIASYNGHANMVKMLAGQADEETLNESLLLASFNGGVGVIEYLLGQGAYINVRSPEGQTPLMIASEQGKTEAVRLLLQNQANPYSLDNEGSTAAMLAEASGHSEIHNLILDPNVWGQSATGEEIREEMDAARLALAAGGAEEVLNEDTEIVKDSEATPPADGVSNSTIAATDAAPDRVIEGAAAASVSVYSPVTNSKKHVADEVIKQSKSKPMVALNGSRIISRTPGKAVVGSMVLAGFREQPLPLALNDVNGGQAGIRRLGEGSQGVVRVKEGRVIPGTHFRLQSVTKKFVSSKEGKGRMVDASRATIVNTETGTTHLLVKDAEGYSSGKYAMLASSGSDFRYVVKTGDVFESVQPGLGQRSYQVLDIRPDSVIIKDTVSGEVKSITRQGLAASSE